MTIDQNPIPDDYYSRGDGKTCPNCRATFVQPHLAWTRSCPDCLSSGATCVRCQNFGFIKLSQPDKLCPCCGVFIAGPPMPATKGSVQNAGDC